LAGLLRVGFDNFGGRAPPSSTPVPIAANETAPRPLDTASSVANSAVAVTSERKPATSSASAPFWTGAVPFSMSAPQVVLDPDAPAVGTASARDNQSTPSRDASAGATVAEDVTGTMTGGTSPRVSRESSLPSPAPKAADAGPHSATGGWTALHAGIAAGDPAAAYEMGSRLAEARGVPVNPREAAVWFDRAAKAGSIPALFRLAALYEKGDGLKKDLQEARRLYLAAAEKGHAKAMHNLAVLYAEGVDGKPDYTTAAHWFLNAANYAIADSQFNLGVLFSRGIGVERNLVESYKWFALAAAQGDPDAAKRLDDVAAQLNSQSLSTARLAVQSFVAQTQPAAATVGPPPPGGWDQPPSSGPTTTKPKSPGRVTLPQAQKASLY
jgi:localization factor PodJL